MTITESSSLNDRFSSLLGVLRACVAASIAHKVEAAVVVLLDRRLSRLMVRFAAAILLPDAPARASGPARIRPAAAARAAGVLRPPSRFGWLVRLVPYVSSYHTRVQSLMADPEMVALFGKPRVGRVLRPLCRMLAVEIPPALRLPPRPRKPGGGRGTPRGGTPRGGTPRAVAQATSAQASAGAAARRTPSPPTSARDTRVNPYGRPPCDLWIRPPPRRNAASRDADGGAREKSPIDPLGRPPFFRA